jgi:hypothetical protein
MRSVERRFVGLLIGAAVLFTANVLVWRFGSGAMWWESLPEWPRAERWGAFGLYASLMPLTIAAMVAMALAAIVRWALGAPVNVPGAEIILPVLTCLLVAGLYVPFAFISQPRMDRVQRLVFEPVLPMRILGMTATATMLLAAVLIVTTRQGRKRSHAPLAMAAVLALVLAHLVWIILVFPIEDGWEPADRYRRDLLVPARPCRGALLWIVERYGDYEQPRAVARIDQVWSRFADPRDRGAQAWAVSAIGEWRQTYVWLVRPDMERLRVRRDDPAVVRCDARPRVEVVAPAAWHDLGIAVAR